jgi:hypothetical protein
MIAKKIETREDLPEYGKYVLVNGIDPLMYGTRGWHVCEMNDLEDGVEFSWNGYFKWLTEKGTEIDEVTHWMELPSIDDYKPKPPSELSNDESTKIFELARPFLDRINVTYCKNPAERLKLFMSARFIDIRCRVDGHEYFFEGEDIRSHIQDLTKKSMKKWWNF